MIGLRRWLALLGVWTLASCAANPSYTLRQTLDQLPPGTRLEIQQPLRIPAGQTYLWFQRGRIVPITSLMAWSPHCSLDLHHPLESSRELTGGVFLVTEVSELASGQGMPWVVRPASSIWRDRGSWDVTTLFQLSSADHPEVKRLRCQVMIDSWADYDVITLQGLQTVLGEYFRIRPPSI